MFPIGDDNPTSTRPIITLTLVGACVLVFLYQLTLTGSEAMAFVHAWGFIPGALLGRDMPLASVNGMPVWIRIFTSMFLHGDFMHIIGNMLFLWIFGNNIEDAFGRLRFVVFYALCGVAAAVTQGVTDTHSAVPMIGASGAISGVLGAYIGLFPQARIKVLIWFGIITVVRMRAYLMLGLWFGLQLLNAVLAPIGAQGGVAFWAHVGGFVAGYLLLPLFRPSRRPPVRGPWG